MKWIWLLSLLLWIPGGFAAEDSLRDELVKQAPAWYDRTTDSWQRVAVKPPEPPQESAHDIGGSLAVADAVAWLLVIAVVAVLVWLAVQLWPHEGPALEIADERPRPGPARPHAIAELDLGDERDPEAALAAARAAGDWRRAIVWIYALLLVRLDAAGAIRLRKGATNQRYVRDAQQWVRGQREQAGMLPCLNMAISAFEQVYFGGLNATHEQVDSLEARVRTTMSTIADESAEPS